MSSTQRHPESFLARRVAEEEAGSATNPHPESFIAQRLVEHAAQHERAAAPVEIETKDEVVAIKDGDDVRALDKKRLENPVNVQSIAINSISSAARLILSPSALLADGLSNNELNHIPHDGGDLYSVSQSSATTSFKLVSNDLAVEMYYEPGNDNLALVNRGLKRVRMASIQRDNTATRDTFLDPGSVVPFCMAPGPWRMTDNEKRHLADFLILSRRYELQLKNGLLKEAGTKRSLESTVEGVKKRQLTTDQSLVLISMAASRNPSMELVIVRDEYPLPQVNPGQILTIQSVPQSVSQESKGKEAATGPQSSSESYSLSNLRDIVKGRPSTSVFLGHHSNIGRIAVKVIKSPGYAHIVVPRVARSFENEMKLLKQVDHPSIIKFAGSDARLFSIYMEYLPYNDLSGWCHTKDSLFNGTIDDASRILDGIASALEHIHGQQIIHNDIKPGNIIFDRSRGPVLIDFGLASFNNKASTGGTPWYLPPEFRLRTSGSSAAKRDVFSLGVTMLYLFGRTRLPEREVGWNIFKVGEQGSDRDKMVNWIDSVAVKRASLGRTNMELIVAEMLNDTALERISAGEILSRMKA